MAHHEQDREDIMAEAVALIRRVEFRWTQKEAEEPVVAGFKRSGHFSIYFGQDPAYHFDVDGLLRRAYRSGFLYRTQGSTLARMHRERDSSATTLVRVDLDATLLEEFRQELLNRFKGVTDHVDDLEIVDQHPGNESVITSVIETLIHIQTLEIWLAPTIKGKR